MAPDLMLPAVVTMEGEDPIMETIEGEGMEGIIVGEDMTMGNTTIIGMMDDEVMKVDSTKEDDMRIVDFIGKEVIITTIIVATRVGLS